MLISRYFPSIRHSQNPKNVCLLLIGDMLNISCLVMAADDSSSFQAHNFGAVSTEDVSSEVNEGVLIVNVLRSTDDVRSLQLCLCLFV